jgi:AcrR family transcriptional regulator
MCPRPYRTDGRRQAAEKTRARIVASARELIAGQQGIYEFTIDAVASQAGVARMTIYYQFGSKLGLLEALFDDIASRGGICRLAEAFGQEDPLSLLGEFIAVFGQFWNSDRPVFRRLRALAVLDPDFEEALRSRDERRREGVDELIRRLSSKYPQLKRASVDAPSILLTLSSFDTFDCLAGPDRTPEEVVPVVLHLVTSALGLPKK